MLNENFLSGRKNLMNLTFKTNFPILRLYGFKNLELKNELNELSIIRNNLYSFENENEKHIKMIDSVY